MPAVVHVSIGSDWEEIHIDAGRNVYKQVRGGIKGKIDRWKRGRGADN